MKTPAIRPWAIRLSTAVLLLGAVFAPASSGATVLIDLNALAQFQPTPTILLNNPPPKADPVMTEELMARLIKHTRAVPETRSIFAELCVIFELCDGTKMMPMKMAMVQSDVSDDDHYFTLPLEADSTDILILVDHPFVLYAYLTDKTGKLRAAAIDDKNGVRLITNEKAAEKFRAELALFAKEAADLPPTGTAAGNY